MAKGPVWIRAEVLDAILRHARAEAPIECCGLLVETTDTIDECVPTANVRSGETTYQVDPAAHFALLRRVRAEGRRIVGAYHSHPRSAAVPSPSDVAEAHDAELVYVIVSLADPSAPDVRGYFIREGCWEDAGLAVVPERRGPEARA